MNRQIWSLIVCASVLVSASFTTETTFYCETKSVKRKGLGVKDFDILSFCIECLDGEERKGRKNEWADFLRLDYANGSGRQFKAYKKEAEETAANPAGVVSMLQGDSDGKMVGTMSSLECLDSFSGPNQLWMAYVSEVPLDAPPKLDKDQDAIEMFMSVMTAYGAPFQTHMGINRSFQHLIKTFDRKDGTKASRYEHYNLSMFLHGFAAKVMMLYDPAKVYMMTHPVDSMASIMKQSVGNAIHIGEPQYHLCKLLKGEEAKQCSANVETIKSAKQADRPALIEEFRAKYRNQYSNFPLDMWMFFKPEFQRSFRVFKEGTMDSLMDFESSSKKVSISTGFNVQGEATEMFKWIQHSGLMTNDQATVTLRDLARVFTPEYSQPKFEWSTAELIPTITLAKDYERVAIEQVKKGTIAKLNENVILNSLVVSLSTILKKWQFLKSKQDELVKIFNQVADASKSNAEVAKEMEGKSLVSFSKDIEEALKELNSIEKTKPDINVASDTLNKWSQFTDGISPKLGKEKMNYQNILEHFFGNGKEWRIGATAELEQSQKFVDTHLAKHMSKTSFEIRHLRGEYISCLKAVSNWRAVPVNQAEKVYDEYMSKFNSLVGNISDLLGDSLLHKARKTATELTKLLNTLNIDKTLYDEASTCKNELSQLEKELLISGTPQDRLVAMERVQASVENFEAKKTQILLKVPSDNGSKNEKKVKDSASNGGDASLGTKKNRTQSAKASEPETDSSKPKKEKKDESKKDGEEESAGAASFVMSLVNIIMTVCISLAI